LCFIAVSTYQLKRQKESMKKALFILALTVASAHISFAQKVTGSISIDVVMGNRPPNADEVNLMKAEEDKHPNITKSMHDLEEAMKHLHEAPNDFGGHKGQAESDMKQAWVSLRKALYFRIYKDTH
jgi:hypothetical protein